MCLLHMYTLHVDFGTVQYSAPSYTSTRGQQKNGSTFIYYCMWAGIAARPYRRMAGKM